jgi:hypothetical protein
MKSKHTKQYGANRLLTQKLPINSALQGGNGNTSTITQWQHLDRHGPRPQSTIDHLPDLPIFKEKRKRKYELPASMLALLEGQPASSKENESLLAPLSVYKSFHIGVFYRQKIRFWSAKL